MDSNKDKKEHKGTLVLRLVVLMISLLIINVIVHRQAYATWRYEAIALEDGKSNSIAVDSNNKLHISYVDATNSDLKYATNVSGSWVAVTVDSSVDIGYHTSIAVDSNNKVHISYFDATNIDLKYATNVSGSWVAATLDFTGYVGEYTSIAVDSSNKVHISYFDSTNSDLKYATNVSGSWVTATVDSSDVGYHTSIAVDSNNKVHISYHDMTNSDLKYATNVSGSWVTATVDSSGDVVGWYTSIAVDSNNKVHISYADFANSYLKYATNVSGSWVAEIVELQIIYDTSIAVDSNNKVHISYNYNPCDYFYVRYATNVSGSWVMTEIDPSGNASESTSIAIDSNNNAHIIYNDAGLQYVTDAPLVVVNDNDNDGYFSDVDCDDNDPAVNPGATEICDNKDNDCDGQIDEGLADLYISSISAPSSANAGNTISVSDTTNKVGACAIGATTNTKFYFSTNGSTYDALDTYLGSRAVPAFGAGSGSSSGSTSVTIPTGIPVGSYYIIGRADADRVITESNEGNNNRAISIQITANLDLWISSVTAPGSATAGGTILVSDTTSKSGQSTAGASTTKTYFSKDAIYGGDTYLGSRAVPAFGAGSGSSSGSTSVTIPTSACTQTYYLIARADADGVITESNEGNNNRAISIQITNNNPPADLWISSVTAPGSATAGNTISVSDTTNKVGACAIGASDTKIYLSCNGAVYDESDTYLGSRAVGAFGAGSGSSSGSTSVTIPGSLPAGCGAGGDDYIVVRADADGVIAETNEDNNRKSSLITLSP